MIKTSIWHCEIYLIIIGFKMSQEEVEVPPEPEVGSPEKGEESPVKQEENLIKE